MKRQLFSTLKHLLMSFAATNVLFLSGSLAAQEGDKQYNIQLSDPSKPMFLEVELYRGSIVIEGYDGQDVEIVANVMSDSQLPPNKYKQKWRRNWKEKVGAKKTMRSTEGLTAVSHSSFNLEIEESNNRVEVESEHGSKPVALTIKVPMTASIEVELYNGDKIAMTKLSGSVEVESHIGDIIGSKLTGPIVAETHASDIVIEFDTFSESAPTSFTTHSGDIDITLQASAKATVAVQNYQGQILSGLSGEFKSVDKVNKKQREGMQKIEIGSQLQAKLNGGGQEITINTYAGNVYLREK